MDEGFPCLSFSLSSRTGELIGLRAFAAQSRLDDLLLCEVERVSLTASVGQTGLLGYRIFWQSNLLALHATRVSLLAFDCTIYRRDPQAIAFTNITLFDVRSLLFYLRPSTIAIYPQAIAFT